MNLLKRKSLLFLSAMLCSNMALLAQDSYQQDYRLPLRKWSVGGGLGLTDLWGDVGTTHFINHYGNKAYFKNTRYMAGLFVHYSVKPWLAIRAGFNSGALYASDDYNADLANKKGDDPSSLPYQLYLRNQDVKTSINEGYVCAEITPFHALRNSAAARFPLQPVLLGGIGIFHFNPKTSYRAPDGTTRWVTTHNLHLEGEGLGYDGAPAGYRRTQLNIPVGGGLQFTVNDQVTVGFEYLVRLTFTDYLDGVSGKYVDPAVFDKYLNYDDAIVARQVYNKSNQIDPAMNSRTGDIRGTPKQKDAYSTLGFNVRIRLPDRKPSIY